MKVFVTGGTGFIGRRLVEKLVQRGAQVSALVRSHEGAERVSALGARPVWGDINASESLIEPMRGQDVVFHLAACYRYGYRNRRKMELINVEGTRNVLEQAFQLGVPRILYTSTVAVYGDTKGQIVDETYWPPAGPFLTEYDRTKHLAHYQVALPLIERGAPIIILMPGVVYGEDDPSLIGQLMRLYYLGLLPVFPAPDMRLTFAYVDDIAEGHILAAEKGEIGHTYHLTGEVMSLRQAVQMWAQLCGRRPPWFYVPARWLKPLAPLMETLDRAIGLPPLLSGEVVCMLDASYLASSEKARSQLGWSCRSAEEGFRQTFKHLAATTKPLAERLGWGRRQSGWLVLGASIGFLLAWLLWGKRPK